MPDQRPKCSKHHELCGCPKARSINGAPTAEVDFSTLHPTLLCLENNLAPPDDFYDLGIRVPGFPCYDPDKAPYKAQRTIIKHFANALVNDQRGVHKLSPDSAKILGMDTNALRALLIKTHPVFAKAIKSGRGRGAGFVGPDTALWLGSPRAQSSVCRLGTSVTDGVDVSLALGVRTVELWDAHKAHGNFQLSYLGHGIKLRNHCSYEFSVGYG